MTQQSVRRDRPLMAILSVIAGIVVIAIVVLLTRGESAPVDPSSPEGVVQSYSSAILESDFAGARELLTTEIQENCERNEPGLIRGLRMVIISTTVNGDNAVVRVAIEYGSDAFGGSGYDTDESFSLVREAEEWRVQSAPWQLTLCFNQGWLE